MITELSVEGYRSIRKLRVPLSAMNVVVGPNGSGKTNLYQALCLLPAAAAGRLARSIADEGGMPSVLWAGARKKGPVRLTVGVTLDEFTYELVCGLQGPGRPSSFMLDPKVKRERATFLHRGTRVVLLDREEATTWLRDGEGNRVTYPAELRDAESVLSQIRDPHRYPVVASLRQEIGSWRFYHHFSTEPGSALRFPQTGIQTPVLSEGGADLAAALQTVREIGDGQALNEEILRAFPGSRLEIETTPDVRLAVTMIMPGIGRPLRAAELSDGTLRYLCLLAALLSPRPPTLLALNEPETSLHPDLIKPLAHLAARAARSSQVWLSTHSETLASELARLTTCRPVHLVKVQGETRTEREGPSGDEEEEGESGDVEDEESPRA